MQKYVRLKSAAKLSGVLSVALYGAAVGLVLQTACNNGGGGGSSGGAGGSGDEGGASGGQGEGAAGGEAPQGGDSGEGGSGEGGGASAGRGGSGGGGASGSPDAGTADAPVIMEMTPCDPPKLKLTRVGMANVPMVVTQPTGETRLFVAERAGLIRILQANGTFAGTPFLDMRSSVATPAGDNERGLLGLAFHPAYQTNGRFFVFYTRRNNDPFGGGQLGDVVIAEGKRGASADVALAMLKPLVTQRHEADFHNGGFFAFGPDGLIYAGIGDNDQDGYRNWDRNAEIQRVGAAQALDTLVSKIVRVDVDNPSARPAGNYDTAGSLPHIWAIGVRNPFRGSFDRVTGDLYFGDVGEASWEEVNFQPRGEGKRNYGWGQREGKHCFPWFMPVACEPVGVDPLIEYFHEGQGVMTDPKSYMGMGRACFGGLDGDCSRAVVGGYVYRGAKIPNLRGRYLYSDHVKNFVKSLVVSGGKATCERDLTADLVSNATPVRGPTGFGEDAAGELYIFDIFGNIYRIDPE